MTQIVGVSETGGVAKEKLLEILTRLLGSRTDLGFLLQLNQKCLEQLIVAVRVRLETTA
ncbi:MAG TPA: hypothetical protein VMT71_16730 [Syntrophorhabdales bacterium]|nr:hypothetical protein [Syntrophorhabdales bacterium]